MRKLFWLGLLIPLLLAAGCGILLLEVPGFGPGPADWILDTNLHKTYGPYDMAAFNLERQKLGLGSLWLKDPRAYAPAS